MKRQVRDGRRNVLEDKSVICDEGEPFVLDATRVGEAWRSPNVIATLAE